MAISKAFYADWTAAKQSIRNNAKLVTVVRLTKSGQPSKMAEDTKYFNTVEQAQAWIDGFRKLNPTCTINFDIRTR